MYSGSLRAGRFVAETSVKAGVPSFKRRLAARRYCPGLCGSDAGCARVTITSMFPSPSTSATATAEPWYCVAEDGETDGIAPGRYVYVPAPSESRKRVPE